MNIELNHDTITYDHILVRYGELSTKGKNKNEFIKRLLTNIKNALRAYTALTYEKTHDRIYILLNGCDPYEIAPVLEKVFGISSFSFAIKVNSEMEDIRKAAMEVALRSNAKTFKIETKRHYKLFPFISDEINRAVAGDILKGTPMKVDVHEPELLLRIEVRQFDTYLMPNKIKGAGGYPTGIGGKSLLMLSGGIDSPVAAYDEARNHSGMHSLCLSALHFVSCTAEGAGPGSYCICLSGTCTRAYCSFYGTATGNL